MISTSKLKFLARIIAATALTAEVLAGPIFIDESDEDSTGFSTEQDSTGRYQDSTDNSYWKETATGDLVQIQDGRVITVCRQTATGKMRCESK